MKKVPLRKCVVTQVQYPKMDLIRVVLTPEDSVEIDETGRKNGRGAYLKRDLEVVELARKNRALERALRTKIDPSVYDDLVNYIS